MTSKFWLVLGRCSRNGNSRGQLASTYVPNSLGWFSLPQFLELLRNNCLRAVNIPHVALQGSWPPGLFLVPVLRQRSTKPGEQWQADWKCRGIVHIDLALRNVLYSIKAQESPLSIAAGMCRASRDADLVRSISHRWKLSTPNKGASIMVGAKEIIVRLLR